MKKGASHVDWAISMGLFLVFVMLALIFLRPGTEQIYKGDTLLKIIEDGLEEDGYYSIEKQFLVIEPTSISSDKYEMRIRNPTQYGVNPDWKINKAHLGLVNNSLGTVPSEELLYIPYDLDDEYCNINPSDCLGDVLDIETYLIDNEKNIFWFMYSEDVNYPQYDVGIEFPSNPEEGCFGTGTCLLDGENFTYEFGVSEISRGFSEDKLNDLESVDYAILKNDWDIPLDKNFRVTVINLTAYKEDGIDFFRGSEDPVPTGVSIFVKEWKDWTLTPKGELAPVEVRIELW